MRRLVWLAVLLASPSAFAVRGRRTPPPPPPVKLSIEPGADRDHLVFALTNESAEPVRILANRFLLSLELKPEKRGGGRRQCRPPAGLAPRGVSPERIVPLAPGQRYDERIDVRFFCWGQSKLRAKAHTIKAKYGRPGRASADRWVVSNADGTAGHVARLESEPLSVEALPAAERASGPKRGLELTAHDAQSGDGREVIIGLTLVNHGPDPVDVFLHPFAYRFRVSGGAGEVVCAMHDPTRSLSRTDFTRMRRRGRTSARLDMAEFCPPGTFAGAGLYEVHPELVLAHDGAAVGISAQTGTVAAEPILVRVQRGHQARYEPAAAE